ncbi:cytochrome b561 [Polynucleobacter sp. SHI8]|uniref:cytochrome b/b6 domain-containing protein n=1 Tax=unclassified Polynucleobacter TaxID=2640945 RepID=UPI002493841E|nr:MULTISPECIES: cytochrome b/b6 domain-containing protein [unclassified Polynucleobacter]BDW10317.1 cytochrome b561 [Polynucleobacter sp. SHI2]BDW12763.1 cytochrome b561 [Polynucleobacter sp. SHI8]
MEKIRLWDLPTRLFHWLFAVAVLGAIVTDLLENITLHSYFGYSALVLVIFRIIWGFVGPHHARFSSFVPSVSSLKAFLKDQTVSPLGHNPLGALSVIAMLLIVLVQASSGLFTDDEISFQGPLSKFLSEDMVKFMNQIHETNHVLVYGIVALHFIAIFYYQRIKKNNLIGPMVYGDKEIDPKNQPVDQTLASKDDVKIRVLAGVLLIVLIVIFRYFVLT